MEHITLKEGIICGLCGIISTILLTFIVGGVDNINFLSPHVIVYYILGYIIAVITINTTTPQKE